VTFVQGKSIQVIKTDTIKKKGLQKMVEPTGVEICSLWNNKTVKN